MNLTGLAADAVLVIHALFIVFVAFGGVLALWRAGMALAHVPALAWGVWISATHGLCPLTPLEQALRQRAGQDGYNGGFIEHYLTAFIYPAGLTPAHQTAMAALLLILNASVYAVVAWRLLRRRDS